MAADLVNLTRVRAILTGITDTSQDNLLQTLASVASRAVETWTRRQFWVRDYDEFYDSDGSGSIFLRNFPVLNVSRMAMTKQAVIQIRNTNTVTNSRALVATTQVVQQDWPTQTTGITLTRVAGGLSILDATLLWNDYPTVQLLANAVNALVAFGWGAIVTSGMGNWASDDIQPTQGAQNAWNNQANLYAYTTDLNDYDLVPETGEVRFSGSFATLFGTGWVPSQFPGVDLWPGVNLPRGSRNLRAQYTAGFNQIPENVQQATALWAAHLFQQPQFAGNLTSESLADYSYQRAVSVGPPPDVQSLLLPWKDWRI